VDESVPSARRRRLRHPLNDRFKPAQFLVANGSKHMMQTRAMTRAGGSEQTRNDVTIVVGRGVKHTFYIQDGRAGGAEYEAVDLADLCIAEWRSFLSAHQLDHGLNGFS